MPTPEPPTDSDWIEITRRNARSVQTTIGWIFWDPAPVAAYEALGVPGPLGYIAARAAPLAPDGPDAVAAAFGSIGTHLPARVARQVNPRSVVLHFRPHRAETQYRHDACTGIGRK